MWGLPLTLGELHGVDVSGGHDLGVGLDFFGFFDTAVHDVGSAVHEGE